MVNGGMVGMYVTSYGDHFPLVHLGRRVRGMRTSRRLRVTTVQAPYANTPHEDTLPMTCKDMVVIMNHGIVGVAVGMAV